MDEYGWPEGFHKNQDMRFEGPEAKPGNMQVLVAAVENLQANEMLHRERINELQAKVVELEAKQNES